MQRSTRENIVGTNMKNSCSKIRKAPSYSTCSASRSNFKDNCRKRNAAYEKSRQTQARQSGLATRLGHVSTAKSATMLPRAQAFDQVSSSRTQRTADLSVFGRDVGKVRRSSQRGGSVSQRPELRPSLGSTANSSRHRLRQTRSAWVTVIITWAARMHAPGRRRKSDRRL